MSQVQVKYGDSAADTAVLLLAAAEESKNFTPHDVRTGSFGTFYVPEEIAKSAGVDYIKDDAPDSTQEFQDNTPVLDDGEPDRYTKTEADEAPAPKKATARKTAAKKTTESQE